MAKSKNDKQGKKPKALCVVAGLALFTGFAIILYSLLEGNEKLSEPVKIMMDILYVIIVFFCVGHVFMSKYKLDILDKLSQDKDYTAYDKIKEEIKSIEKKNGISQKFVYAATFIIGLLTVVTGILMIKAILQSETEFKTYEVVKQISFLAVVFVGNVVALYYPLMKIKKIKYRLELSESNNNSVKR